MSEESKSIAVVYLIKIWEFLNRIKNPFSTSIVESVETNDESVNNTCEERIADDTEDEFQLYLLSIKFTRISRIKFFHNNHNYFHKNNS